MHPSHRQQLNALLLAGAVVTAACGGSPASPAAPQVVIAAGGVTGSISANHPAPHVAVITAAQLSAGAAILLDISNGLHGHTVSLTAGMVGQIAAGARVVVDSSTNPHSNGSDPHQHTVTFN